MEEQENDRTAISGTTTCNVKRSGNAHIEHSQSEAVSPTAKEASLCVLSSSNSINTSIIEDLSLMLEKSFVLQSTKYAEKRPRFVLHYLRFTTRGVIYPFIITISRKCNIRGYSGYDSSSYCIVETEQRLSVNTRYLVYGKIRSARFLVVEAIKIQPVNYKSLCYSSF